MIALLLILLPLAAAVAAWPVRRENSARILLLLSACVHTGLTVCCVTLPPAMSSFRWNGQEWIGLDDAGMIFLMVTSLLFLFVALHTVLESVAEGKNGAGLFREHFHLPCLLGFLATMTLVITARNFGLLWVAVEATTLVSAPLILLHRSGRSLEAMWKYLLICSVGIGFALLGTMLTAVSARAAGAAGLSMSDLAACSAAFPDDWFKASFVLILAGYGTKTGLAPFHTWLPDAHSEAPATVSALLSGSLLNCSFLAVIRFCQIAPERVRPFCNELLTALGIFSLVVAAFFIIRQSGNLDKPDQGVMRRKRYIHQFGGKRMLGKQIFQCKKHFHRGVRIFQHRRIGIAEFRKHEIQQFHRPFLGIGKLGGLQRVRADINT